VTQGFEKKTIAACQIRCGCPMALRVPMAARARFGYERCRLATANSRVCTDRIPSVVQSSSNLPAPYLSSELGPIAQSYRPLSSCAYTRQIMGHTDTRNRRPESRWAGLGDPAFRQGGARRGAPLRQRIAALKSSRGAYFDSPARPRPTAARDRDGPLCKFDNQLGDRSRLR
jgi:hypothetical protein